MHSCLGETCNSIMLQMEHDKEMRCGAAHSAPCSTIEARHLTSSAAADTPSHHFGRHPADIANRFADQ
jgi:hypothetical protein